MTSPSRISEIERRHRCVPSGWAELNPVIEQRAGGVIHIRARGAACPLSRQAQPAARALGQVAPDRLFLAQRDAQGEWRKLSYAQALSDVRQIGAALLRREALR